MFDKPIYQCTFISNRYVLYSNRLEISQDPIRFERKEVIKLKEIAEVRRPFGNRIEIVTLDGNTFTLNIVGQPATELVEKIALARAALENPKP